MYIKWSKRHLAEMRRNNTEYESILTVRWSNCGVLLVKPVITIRLRANKNVIEEQGIKDIRDGCAVVLFLSFASFEWISFSTFVPILSEWIDHKIIIQI